MENENVKALSVAGFSNATKKGLKNLFDFKGRASKTEFWWCFLVWAIALPIALICAFMLSVIINLLISYSDDSLVYMGICEGCTIILFLTILLALIHRRLRDTNTNVNWGTWTVILLPFAIIGLFVLIIFVKVAVMNDWESSGHIGWKELLEDLKVNWKFIGFYILNILSLIAFIPVFVKTTKALLTPSVAISE